MTTISRKFPIDFVPLPAARAGLDTAPSIAVLAGSTVMTIVINVFNGGLGTCP